MIPSRFVHQYFYSMKSLINCFRALSICMCIILCSSLFISNHPLTQDFFHNLPQNHFDTLLQRVEKNSPPETPPEEASADLFTVNFPEIAMSEFIRFVSKITKKNFIYQEEALNFSIAFVSGRAFSSNGILQAMQDILEKRGLGLVEREDYFLIEKLGITVREEDGLGNLTASLQLPYSGELQNKLQFIVHKLKYHEGSEILSIMKQMTNDPELLNKSLCQTIQSMQFNKNTNSISFFGSSNSIEDARNLLTTLDAPLKQVFIEVLVLETNVSDALEFGVEWSLKSSDPKRYDASMNTMLAGKPTHWGYDHEKGTRVARNPGINLNLGIIGDRILHKNNYFPTLSALVSALQKDSNSTIVLNQKIITQDNKNSKIFVGDTIPFSGSTVQITGIGQQITTNIDYRDVGVSLNIKPLLGDGDIITIELSEEITDALEEMVHPNRGIRTTKTNMITSTHVPDQHFLLLSGSNRTVQRKARRGVPCLGAIPLIGKLFSTESTEREKRSTLIFIRPQVIHSAEQYKDITQRQTNACSKESKQALKNSCVERH